MTDRFEGFAEMLKAADIAENVRRVATQALEMLQRVRGFADQLTAEFDADEIQPDVIRQHTDERLNSLRHPLSESSPALLLAWCIGVADYVSTTVHGYADALEQGSEYANDFADTLRGDAVTLRDTAGAVMDALAMRVRAEKTVQVAEEAARRAQQAQGNAERASGEVGESALSEHFAGYASAELKLASRFRLLTVLLIAAAVTIGALVLLLPDWKVDANDWTGFATKFAVLAGLGSLAAFFARQSSTHRRAGTWAKALELQLDSFPAFIDAVPEEVRATAYLALGTRVLSPPPNKDGDHNAETAIPHAQLIELVTASLRRT